MIYINTLTSESAPFIIVYEINGQKMERMDDNYFKTDLDLQTEDKLIVSAINEFNTWWIDFGYFGKNDKEI